MALDMMGLKKDMEAAMGGAEKRGEKEGLTDLKKMYGKYVSKSEEEEDGEEEDMEKMNYKSLSYVVRAALRK